MIVQTAPLGFSLNPFHYAKKAVKTVAHDVRHPLDTAKSAANTVGHAVKVGIIKPFEWVASKVTAPIRNRVHTLRNRRAAKLAWDNRKSKTPNAAEQAQAKAWTKAHLKHQGPHGAVLALFAGSESMTGYGMGLGYAAQLGDPATISLIAASIPVFMALMNSILKKANKSGEAPANPAADAAAAASSGTAAAAGAGPPGAAADAGAEAGAGAGGDDGSGGGDGSGGSGGGGAMVKLPGGTKIKKKTLMIGGAIFGGLVLVLLLTPPKKS